MVRQVCEVLNTWALVLAMYDEPVYAERTLWLGPKAFISKTTTPEEVVSAVRTWAGDVTAMD